jgi:rubredoxin
MQTDLRIFVALSIQCIARAILPILWRFIHGKMSGSMSDGNATKTWMCLICGWIYDESTGAADHGIAPGTPWAQVPMNWTCPECGARKEDFEMVQI